MKCTLSMVAAIFCAAVVLSGCGGDDDNSSPATVPSQTSRNPSPPPIGETQIDRMGRAVVNTALTNPIFRETVARERTQHEVITDDYNEASEPSQWVSRFSEIIATNLAILDSIDGVCGNQILAGPTAVAGRYKTLADILADDQLYVNTASGTCNQYLAVEANAIGVTNADCGGRTPLENTADVSYSVFITGTLTGVTNGITVDADGTASLTAFPFLAQPVPKP